MLKKCSLGLIVSGVVFAGQMTTLTFFPSAPHSPSYINEQYDRLSVYKDVLTIPALPAGIIPESIDVIDPIYERLSFRYDFDSPDTFYSKLRGKTVYFETDEGIRKETTFIKKQGDDVFVRQGSQLVVNPVGRLFVPLNERYIIEPELDIEVSSRYKAYKQATISYYNSLLTSAMQYEFKVYQDSSSVILLAHLMVNNQSNKDWYGMISYSSKTPLFSSPRVVSSYSLYKDSSRSENVETFHASEIFKETLKKSFEIPIGQTKISLYQTNFDVVEQRLQLSFSSHQNENSAERILNITNNSDRSFLSGTARTYIDDELSLLSSIPYTSIGDIVTIPLSRVEEVNGKKYSVREAISREETSGPGYTLNNSVEELVKVMIDVSNMSDREITLHVDDELPYGAIVQEDYKVDIDSKGHFIKVIALKPMEKKELEYHYSIQQ